MQSINIKTESGISTVGILEYVTAKTKDLVEFGYKDLTEETVLDSVNRMVEGDGVITVIDAFVKCDIII